MDFYYFDPDDPMHGLDKPMLAPNLIPEGKMQHYDEWLGRWVLMSRRGGRKEKPIDNLEQK